MTGYLKKTHFWPIVKNGQGLDKAANSTACGRVADYKIYKLRSDWSDVDCPGCQAAKRGKENLDARRNRS